MTDLTKRRAMLSGEIEPMLNEKKKGIEKRILNKETKKENSKAERVKRTFFCEMADAADNTAEIKAIKNQFIVLPVNLKFYKEISSRFTLNEAPVS